MILDTDILIWYLRGNPNAKVAVESAAPFCISAITYMELVQGMKNKKELNALKKVISEMDISILPITSAISFKACALVETHFLSDSVELADALIAATCINNGEPLFTANDKHYKNIFALQLKTFRP